MKKLYLALIGLIFIAGSCNSSPHTDIKQGRPANTPLIQDEKIVPKKSESKCDPNYSGCVPIAGDVDCTGGSGNGPAFVQGPIKVTGSDIYSLDRDQDGIACE